MNTNKLIALTAAAAFLFGAAAAHASTPPSSSLGVSAVNVTYSASTSDQTNATNSNPGLVESYSNSNGFDITEGTPTGGTGGISFVTSTPTAFLQTDPGSDPCGTYRGSNKACIASEEISYVFSFTDALGGTGSLDITAMYYASYTTNLGCDPDPVNSGNSDCIIWEGTGGSSTSFGTGSVTDTVDLDNPDTTTPDGSVVTLTFDNAQDWDITSNISGTFSYAPMTPTPEPASIVLFLSGLAGLPIIRSRMNRKQAAATVAA